DTGAKTALAKNVAEADGYRLQSSANLGEYPADHQDRAHQYIRQPGAESAHRACSKLVKFHLNGADPLGRPLFGISEIPGFLRRQEVVASCSGNDGQTEQATQQGWKLRAEKDAGSGIGQGEGQAGEECERQDFEARFPAFLLAEKAR